MTFGYVTSTPGAETVPEPTFDFDKSERGQLATTGYLRAASNPYGVRVMHHPRGLTTKTYHGIAIIINNTVIGRVQSWTPQMYTRDGVHIYEVGVRSWGRPVDYVPGPGRNFSISCSNTEVWNRELERATGSDIYDDLMDQRKPFKVYEMLFKGEEVYTMWTYYNCWFADKNINSFEAEGDAKVSVNATINFVSRIRGV